MPKKCPNEVKTAGAMLLRARRTAKRLRVEILEAIAAIEATKPVMTKAGAKEMEYGDTIAKMMQAAMADGLLDAAHDHLRQRLVSYGFAEPTDADMVSIIGRGGGGR